ncbi:hypothetical protein SESBI_23548 [Sesbania bispinosa]|nr:hypothetical protein SESBI_23548 [Sesbania bispinosa]
MKADGKWDATRPLGGAVARGCMRLWVGCEDGTDDGRFGRSWRWFRGWFLAVFRGGKAALSTAARLVGVLASDWGGRRGFPPLLSFSVPAFRMFPPEHGRKFVLQWMSSGATDLML